MNSVDKAREAQATMAEERPLFFQNKVEEAMFRCGYVFGYEACKAEALRRGTVPQKGV